MQNTQSPAQGPRPLLPRKTPFQGHFGAAGQTVAVARPKPPTKNACEECRRRKIKCDGERPKCSACHYYDRTCIFLSLDPGELRSTALKRKYDEAQGRASSYEELYTLLKTRTQPEAHEMLRRIRAGMDVESVLRHVKDGDLLLQLHLTPEARLRYIFPEFASWPTIFRDPDDPYLRTPLLDSPPGMPTPLGDAASLAPSALRTPAPDEHVYQMPYHAAHVVDPRLSSVRAATWTSVTTDSGLVSRLLAIYFQYEYPGTRILQKDLFLEDLVRGNTGRSSFCSPLLVNVILANAAHGLASDPNRVEFWTPQSLPYAFLAEAKRLWDIEISQEPKLTTIHAALALSVRYTTDGADKIGLPFVTKAVELAERMELFTRLEGGNSRMSRGRAFTAWALFCWQAASCYYQRRPPLAATPPITPPLDSFSSDKMTGEIFLKYPLQATLTPLYLGALCRAWLDLELIMHEINCAGPPGPAPSTLREALDFHKGLEAWYEALPTELQANRIAIPHHLQLHMQYYLVVINLFEPWTTTNTTTTTPPSNPDSDSPRRDDDLTPAQIGTRAAARLETLIRLYYLRHSFDALDVVAAIFLIVLGSISVRVLAEQTGSKQQHDASTFLLCAKGLHDQGRNFYLAAMMFDMLAGLVDPGNEALLGDLAKIRGEFAGVEVKPERVHMEWSVSRWMQSEGAEVGRLLDEVDELGDGGDEEEDETSADGGR